MVFCTIGAMMLDQALLVFLTVGAVIFGNMLAVRVFPGERLAPALLAMGGVIGLAMGEKALVMSTDNTGAGTGGFRLTPVLVRVA